MLDLTVTGLHDMCMRKALSTMPQRRPLPMSNNRDQWCVGNHSDSAGQYVMISTAASRIKKNGNVER